VGTPLEIPRTVIPEVLGIEIALVLRTAELLHRGVRTDGSPVGMRLWEGQRGPWLIGATTRPRAAESARQLYAEVPAALEAFLSANCDTHEELETAFWSAVQGL
jgi:hypothetical protein